MITRRRGRAAAATAAEEQLSESDGGNAVIIDSPSERFPADDTDAAQVELEDLFGFDELAWMLERDPTPTLADFELDDLSASAAQGQDSGTDASMGSSPVRLSSGANRKNQSSFVGNKNAIAARLNRLKKKEYVSSLEKKVGLLSSENGGLKRQNSELTKRVEELEDETRGAKPTSMTMPCPRNE